MQAFLSHDDAGRYFVRVIESPTPAPGESLICSVASRPHPQQAPPVDATPAAEMLGYKAADVWPEGIPFPGLAAGAKLG